MLRLAFAGYSTCCKSCKAAMSPNVADCNNRSAAGNSSFMAATTASPCIARGDVPALPCILSLQDVGECLLSLLYYPERQQLVLLTTSGSAMVLGSNSSKAIENGSMLGLEWSTIMKVKFAGVAGGAKLHVCWAGPHTLASATDQNSVIKLLQLDTDDNYVLELNQADFIRAEGQADSAPALAGASAAGVAYGGITALAYEPRQQVLGAATDDGGVCLFRRWSSRAPAALTAAAALDPAKQWEPQHCFQVGKLPTALGWGPSAQLVAASCTDGLQLCSRSLLHHKLCEGYAVIQVAAGRLLLEQLDGVPRPPGRLSSSLQLTGLDVTKHALLLHDSTRAEVYRIAEADNSMSLASHFDSPHPPKPRAAPRSPADRDGKTDDVGVEVTVASSLDGGCSMALYSDSVYRTAEGRVEVCNLAGVVKQTLVFDDAQGQPLLLDTHNEFLAVLTSKALVRVFRLAGREAKPHAGPGPLLAVGSVQALVVDTIRVNCNGTMICAVGSLPGSGGCQDPRLFVYSTERNGPLVYDFSAVSKAPKVALWDLHDARLLAVQTGPLMQQQSSDSRSSSDGNDSQAAAVGSTNAAESAVEATSATGAAVEAGRSTDIAIMFATAEAGVLLQEYQDIEAIGASGFLGVSAPNLLLHKKAMVSIKGAPPFSSNITRIPLPGFTGLADADAATRQALLDFNYHLAVGKLEDAFRAVAALRSAAVWRSMAHMAIKNKRLDVAEHCLGNMEHVRGARAVRESQCIAELDARVGIVAVQLGLTEDAARLFAGCERWDLLEQLHQSTGAWDTAVEVASKQDRIHLPSVHYAYARHLEAIGDYKAAMQQYLDSGAGDTEVPRMLWQFGRLPDLEQLINRSNDPVMLEWWAKYCESTGKHQQALNCYQRTGNTLAALRLYCATGNWQAADELVFATQDPAAAFHLARVFEAQDKVPEALRCFSISKRYSHGARLAKRNGMDQELLSLALKSPPAVMLDAADHLLASGNAEAAALLYQKGGKLGKALDMAFSAGLYDVLDQIAEQLDKAVDPTLMARCAEAFVSAGHHAKAVRLLLRAGEVEAALQLLVNQDMPLTEELAEALTPEKTPENADSRRAVLLKIGQVAKHQGLYHLACKKYTQAGDRLKAMKALVKSGDTEKIVFFAGVSRQREVYIMAANYLQNLDWRTNPQYLKHIITFYTKAGAADSLASFYMGCAQLEIDEYKEYGKALQALQEAAKHLANSCASDRETQLAALEQHTQRISRFSSACSMLANDPAEAVNICQQLLQEVPNQQDGMPDVRIGDIYALLVEWCYQQGNMVQAQQLMQQMAGRGLQPQAYITEAMVADVCQATGTPMPARQQQQPHQHHNSSATVGPATGTNDEDVVPEELPYIQDQED
eukprot:GHRR01012338.1.p1 GENE.GHRR01012338.1~~GHRR01012338.1.p1  ORF type:complete len:1377 (+),score=585.08 GHRR01012338.1:1099-5229(+)